MKKRNPEEFIRCTICGKFIKYDDLDKATIKSTFTPDTLFTIEEIKYAHQICLDNEQLR